MRQCFCTNRSVDPTSPRRSDRILLSFAIALLLLVAGCGDDGEGETTPTPTHTEAPTSTPTDVPTSTPSEVPTSTPTDVPTATAPPTATETTVPTATVTATESPLPSATPTVTSTPAPLTAHSSVEQIYVTGAAAEAAVELIAADETVVMSGTTDAQGTLVFREVPPAEGYRVATGSGAERYVSEPVAATDRNDPPDPSLYSSQSLERGYGYIETRDGTLLAVNVLLPGPIDQGPYPTVVEYSGYDPANPESPQPSMMIANLLGYAAVGVNMRGTGCSGGSFQFFEVTQLTDGYDAIEIVAAQPWVRENRVGMVGLSYPGISQLFVAQLQPPSLAAIAPLSVISDTGRGTLYPGGILNNGFATDWAADRRRDAQPGGQPWSQKRMDEGDTVCIENQKLRGQTPDILDMIEDNQFYRPEIADPLAPVTFVDQIEVPVFLSGAWQDEQTGGYFATMLGNFTGTDRLHFTLINGGHTDPLGPAIFGRWYEFLSFYVREEIPAFPPDANFLLQIVAQEIFGVGGLTVEPDRFTDAATFEDALARYESEPPVRVLFENGAGGQPGAPIFGFEESFDGWPIPETAPTAWYFAEDGRLLPAPESGEARDSFVYDHEHSQETTYEGPGSGIWKALPDWNWPPLQDGNALAYATEPLAEDLVMVGSASLDLWLGATADDIDLQVTLSEIRPDGQEVYVQNGWLRASRRALDPEESTVLRPVHTHREEDAAPLPAGEELVETRVEVFPFAHVFRADSRIRISINAPGRSRPLWQFRVLEPDQQVTGIVGRGGATPSRVVFPVIPGIEVPTDLPPCPSLRGQPCREYVEIENTPG